MRSLHTTRKIGPSSATRESPQSNEDPAWPKRKSIKFFFKSWKETKQEDVGAWQSLLYTLTATQGIRDSGITRVMSTHPCQTEAPTWLMTTKHLFRKRSSVSLRKLLFCFPVAQTVKDLPAIERPRFDPWAAKIPWRREKQPITRSEESGGLQSMGSQRVRHNWVTFVHPFIHGAFSYPLTPPQFWRLRIWLPTRVTSPRHCCLVPGWVNQRSMSQERVSQQLWLRATKVYSCNKEEDPITKKMRRAETWWGC